MEEKRISFGKGIQRSPSLATDPGELSECVNLIPRGGELVNIRPPKEIGITAPSGTRLMAIHHVDDTRHYIFYGNPKAVTEETGAGTSPEDSASDGNASDTIGGTITPDSTSGNVLRRVLYIYVYSNGSQVTVEPSEAPDSPITISVGLTRKTSFGTTNKTQDFVISSETAQIYETSYSIKEEGVSVKSYNGSTYSIKILYESPSNSAKSQIASTTYTGLTFIDENEPTTKYVLDEDASQITHVEVMGNFIITLGSKGLCYYIWKDDEYINLGEMPEIDMRFQLDGDFKTKYYEKILSFNYKDKDRGIKSVRGTAEDLFGTDTPDLGDALYSVPTATGHGINTSGEELHNAGLTYGKFYLARYCSSDFTLGVIYYGESEESTDYYSGLNIVVGKESSSSTDPYVYVKFLLTPSVTVHNRIYASIDIFECPAPNTLNDLYEITYEDDTSLTAMLASAEDFLDYYYNEQHKFIYPFFVRYALKMYDNTYVHQSAPILMIPNSSGMMQFECDSIPSLGKTQVVSGSFNAFIADLQYRIADISNLKQWEGLITGIDIAISDPIIRYNASAEWDANINRIALCTCADEWANYAILSSGKLETTTSEQYCVYAIPPAITKNNYLKQFKNVSNFYVVKSIDFNEITTSDTFETLDMEDVDLNGLDALEAMYDSPTTFNHMIASTSFVYNQKLHLANLQVGLNTGLSMPSPMAKVDNKAYKYRLVISAQDRGKTATTASEWKVGDPEYSIYFFTDIEHVIGVTIYRYSKISGVVSYQKASFKVNNHSLLTGMYFFNFASGMTWEDTDATEANQSYTGVNNYLDYRNEIYASKTGNPFNFPATGMTSVGQDEIQAVSTSAKAMSSGTSFGQYPLYCFCTDGVWPLSVNTDGTYNAPNPASREPCNNTDSICQIDGAVVYSTMAGLMLIQGEEVKTLSEVMKGYNVSEDQFFSSLEQYSKDHFNLVLNDTNSIVDLLAKSKIICDYAHSLIHIYPEDPVNDAFTKHYVFSFAENAWSTVSDDYGDVSASVVGYPCTTIQMSGSGELMQFTSDEDLETLRNGIILTRPVAFDDPMAMKVLCDMRTIYTEGEAEEVKTQIFVSNDRVKWGPLTSLRAHAYKWYRFRVRTTMNDNDALTGIVAMVEARRMNKLR